MGGKYINPFTDFGFKRLFGTEMNKELLISFLNSLLHNQEEITDITYRNTEQLGSRMLDRKAIFDVYCQNTAGEYFIVEMQKAEQNYFKDRSVFYATFPIRDRRNQAANGTSSSRAYIPWASSTSCSQMMNTPPTACTTKSN